MPTVTGKKTDARIRKVLLRVIERKSKHDFFALEQAEARGFLRMVGTADDLVLEVSPKGVAFLHDGERAKQ